MTRYEENYTSAEKIAIAAKLKQISAKDALEDFLKLKTYSSNGRLSLIGNKCVDYFTFVERLNTRSNKGGSYFELLANFDELLKKPYIGQFVMYKTICCDKFFNEEQIVYELKRLYFASVNVFKPTIAALLYEQYKPSRILDPTAGWGGRLIAAMSRDIDYIGIELNTQLRQPYFEMLNMLQPHSASQTHMIFEDALKVDYAALPPYDMVFTSPPYYNKEIYSCSSKKTIDEWDSFYTELFSKTWRHLQHKGHFIINIPTKLYYKVAKPLLGECSEKIPLSIQPRSGLYKEFMYVWKKL